MTMMILYVLATMVVGAALYWRLRMAPVFFLTPRQEQSQFQKQQVLFTVGILYQMQLSAKYANNKTFIRTIITNVSSMSWHTVQQSQLSHLKTVIIYDNGPCFWLASGRSTKNSSGGESIWCASIIGQLLDQDRYVYVTDDATVAMTLAMSAHQGGHGAIMIAHWGWRHIAMSKTPLPPRLRNPPQSIIGGIDCILKMHYWGTKVATELWPGDLKHYISPYPLIDNNVPVDGCSSMNEAGGYNTATGFGDQFIHCGDDELGAEATMFSNASHLITSTDSTISTDTMISEMIRDNRSYYVIYGKFGNLISTKLINPIFSDESLWHTLHNELHLQGVILTCNNSLFPVLRTSSSAFLCLDESSVFKDRPWYPYLLRHAVFLLGLGHPKLSTSPFDALACHTNVILPVGMHSFLERTSQCNPSKRFHVVTNTREILHAANVSLQQHFHRKFLAVDGEGEEEEEEDMMGFRHMKDDFLQLVEIVENQCAKRVGMGVS